MLIPFRKFRASDLEILVPNSIDKDMRDAEPKIWQSWGEYYEKFSVGYTACIDNVPIAALGVRLIRPGVGNAWAYISKEAMKHRFSLLRSIKLMQKYVFEACDFKKVRASVRLELKGADVLAKHLGFKKARRRMMCGTHDFYILEV